MRLAFRLLAIRLLAFRLLAIRLLAIRLLAIRLLAIRLLAIRLLAASLLLAAGACGDAAPTPVDATVGAPDTAAHDVPSGPLPVCGDGKVEGDERCDEGDDNGAYAHCTADCLAAGAFCGDGVLDTEHEACDDGAANGTWNHCSVACNGPGIRCGNGFIETDFELCDDGDDKNGRYGFCAADCQGAAATCGDGVVTPPAESCDEGPKNGTPGHCASDCAPTPGCGDALLVAPEACDEGPANGSYGHCAADCSGMGSRCGDGLVLATAEACDDGAANGDYGRCRSDCQALGPHCGDGILDVGDVGDAGEVCDDGAANGDDGHCETDCSGTVASWLKQARMGHLGEPNACEDDLLGKYMHYRKILRGDGTAEFPGFVVRENIPGGGIPAAYRNKSQTCSNWWGFGACARGDLDGAHGLYKWGDGTSWVGDWIGLLALEHAMFTRLGMPTDETEADLRVALATIDRLDSAADTYFGLPAGTPDGFFLRDDVPRDFAQSGGNWRFPQDPAHTGYSGYGCIGGDLACTAPSVEDGSYTSQDQSISLVYGLAMVAKLVPPSALLDPDAPAAGSLREASRAKIHLLVSALRDSGWKVRAPDGTTPPDKWGGNAIWFSDALAKVADRVVGEDYGVSGYRNFQSRTLGAAAWDAFQLIWRETHFYNRNMLMMMAGAGNIWGIDKLAKRAAEENKDYYALVGAVMTGVRKDGEAWTAGQRLDNWYAGWRVESILRSAGCGGACIGHWDCDAKMGWLSESRIFTAHARAGSRHVPEGEFNGIDYMSLFAAWVLYRGDYRTPQPTSGTCDAPVALAGLNVGDVFDPRTPCAGADLDTLYCGRAVGSWVDDAARGRVSIFVRGARLQCEVAGTCVLVGSGPEHTDGDDLVIGSAGDDEFEGGDGQDCLIGLGGNDTIEGNQGLDHIEGGEGDDHLYGEGRGLIVDGEPDVIHGGPGNDLLDGAPGFDELYGEDGDDKLLGGNGEDILIGGNGNDELHGGPNEDILRGGPGDDLCIGDADDDEVYGEEGRDRIDGEAGNDYVDGGPGSDFVKGGTGDDELGSGDWGATSPDRLCGNGGNDIIWSGNDGDTCLGGGWLVGGKDEVNGCVDGSASEHDCNAGSFNDW